MSNQAFLDKYERLLKISKSTLKNHLDVMPGTYAKTDDESAISKLVVVIQNDIKEIKRYKERVKFYAGEVKKEEAKK